MVNEPEPAGSVQSHRRARRVIGLVLLAALVVSWFVWGPDALIMYVGGLFNSISILTLAVYLFPVLILGAIAGLIVVIVDLSSRRRTFSHDQRLHRLILAAVCVAYLGSFALGFAGLVPPPFDMYVKGFVRHARSRMDVEAVQTWLSTLDSSKYIEEHGDPSGAPIPAAELPAAIAKLHPHRFPHGVRVLPDREGRLMVHLMWGGGFMGHWGIVVGHRDMEVPKTKEPGWVERQYGGRTDKFYEYGEYRKALAPGAYVWAELE